jgi:hypothetical protein
MIQFADQLPEAERKRLFYLNLLASVMFWSSDRPGTPYAKVLCCKLCLRTATQQNVREVQHDPLCPCVTLDISGST